MSPTKQSFFIPITVALVAGGMFLIGKYMEQQDLSPVVVSVQGEGKMSAAPDIAQVQFGMQTGRVTTAEGAMAALAREMNSVIAAVKGEGIDEKDITTQNLSLRPAYDWKDGERIDRGFEASQNLLVKVRDVSKIGAVLTAATKSGANQAGGVSFTIDDPDELRAQARTEAIADAEAKAKILAEQLGKRVGALRSYSEDGGSMPPAVYRMAMNEAVGIGGGGGDGGVPVPSGEQEVRVTVSLSYELN